MKQDKLKYLTDIEMRKELIKNKEKYVGKIIIDKQNRRLRIVEITEDGIKVMPDMPAS